MNKIALSFLLFLSFSGIDTCSLFAQASGTDNPIMVIRCRYDGGFAFTSDDTKSTSKVNDPCSETNFGDVIIIPNPDPNSTQPCIPKCFNGEVKMVFSPLDCESNTEEEEGVVETQVCFTSADGDTPLQVGQNITFDDISNCLNSDGTELLEDFFQSQPGGDIGTLDELGFRAAELIDGEVKVCINIFVYPSEVVNVNLIDATGETIVEDGIDGDPCTAAADPGAIPTLSQWGLLILSLITSCLALGFMLKHKPTAGCTN